MDVISNAGVIFFGYKCKHLWKNLSTVFDTDLIRARQGARGFA